MKIGGCGLLIGFGSKWMLSNCTYFPWNEGLSFVHSSMIAARYSSVILPRSWYGTPSISNSRSRWPDAVPSVIRPFERKSSVAICFASTTGLR